MKQKDTIGSRLSKIRKDADLSQAEFAKQIQAHAKTVQRWELKDAYPSGDALSKISQVFFVDLNWLISGDGNPYLPKPPINFLKKQGPFKKAGKGTDKRSQIFSEKLRLAILHSRISAERAAAGLDVSIEDYLGFESGFIPNPDMIHLISTLFNCDSVWLLSNWSASQDGELVTIKNENINDLNDNLCIQYLLFTALQDLGAPMKLKGIMSLHKVIEETAWEPFKKNIRDLIRALIKALGLEDEYNLKDEKE